MLNPIIDSFTLINPWNLKICPNPSNPFFKIIIEFSERIELKSLNLNGILSVTTEYLLRSAHPKLFWIDPTS